MRSCRSLPVASLRKKFLLSPHLVYITARSSVDDTRSVSVAILELPPPKFRRNPQTISTANDSSSCLLTARCGAELIDLPVKVTLLGIWYKFRKPPVPFASLCKWQTSSLSHFKNFGLYGYIPDTRESLSHMYIEEYCKKKCETPLKFTVEAPIRFPRVVT